jgi:predicted HAD superfamily Cof-like phosphohydrolase
MAKVDPVTRKVKRREDGKILKPEGWTPPDMTKFIKKKLP